MADGKAHLSIVICGHVDAGKSTTTGRLIFELGGISEREVEKLKAEADKLGKGESCPHAFRPSLVALWLCFPRAQGRSGDRGCSALYILLGARTVAILVECGGFFT